MLSPADSGSKFILHKKISIDILCCFSTFKKDKKCGFHHSAKSSSTTDFQINKWQLQSPPGDPSGGARGRKRDVWVVLLAVTTVPLTWISSLKTEAWMDDYNPVYGQF